MVIELATVGAGECINSFPIIKEFLSGSSEKKSDKTYTESIITQKKHSKEAL